MTKILTVDFQYFTTRETLADTTKLIDGMFYQSKYGPIPAAFCYALEHRETIEGLLKQMKDAKQRLDKSQYDTQVFMRKEFGV